MRSEAAVQIDWSEATTRLRARSGRSLASFCSAVHMDERTLNRLARGEIEQPRFRQGCLILDQCADWFTDDDWLAVRGDITA